MNKWQLYNQKKEEWLEAHPDATPEEIEKFCKELAKELDI